MEEDNFKSTMLDKRQNGNGPRSNTRNGVEGVNKRVIGIKTQGMSNANNHDERIAKMTFASVYPHYLAKVEKKGRTAEELHRVIEWLTGYDEKSCGTSWKKKQRLKSFFSRPR